MKKLQGLLVINLGTPDAPSTKAVRKYLKQFLSDPRVIDIPKFFRFLLLYLIILPFRSPKSAHAYQSIWTDKGSPLLQHTKDFCDKLQIELSSEVHIEYAMRYQSPSIESALRTFKSKSIQNVVVMPMYPQYSSAANGSSIQEVMQIAAKDWNALNLRFIPPFYDRSEFIDSFASIANNILKDFRADIILFSFHGLPERHCKKSAPNFCFSSVNCCDSINEKNNFCYRAQCFATAKKLADRMGLTKENYKICFQSRLGKTPWIKPYTDEVLQDVVARGIKKVAVMCPAFVTDCLETLEEIKIRAREDFIKMGGEELVLIPSLNSDNNWVKACKSLVEENLF